MCKQKGPGFRTATEILEDALEWAFNQGMEKKGWSAIFNEIPEIYNNMALSEEKVNELTQTLNASTNVNLSESEVEEILPIIRRFLEDNRD